MLNYDELHYRKMSKLQSADLKNDTQSLHILQKLSTFATSKPNVIYRF